MKRTRRKFLISAGLLGGGVVGIQQFARWHDKNDCSSEEDISPYCAARDVVWEGEVKTDEREEQEEWGPPEPRRARASDPEPEGEVRLSQYKTDRNGGMYLHYANFWLTNTGEVNINPRAVLKVHTPTGKEKAGETPIGTVAPGDQRNFHVHGDEDVTTTYGEPADYTLEVYEEDEKITEKPFTVRWND